MRSRKYTNDLTIAIRKQKEPRIWTVSYSVNTFRVCATLNFYIIIGETLTYLLCCVNSSNQFYDGDGCHRGENLN